MTEDTATYHSRHPLYAECNDYISIQEALCDFSSIPGVESVLVKRYSVEITKGALFSWDEVEPAVLSLLKTFEHLEEVKPDA